LQTLAQTVNLDIHIVYGVLKDITNKFVELNSIYGKECSLNLKVGVLHAYSNRDLQFESEQHYQKQKKMKHYLSITRQSSAFKDVQNEMGRNDTEADEEVAKVMQKQVNTSEHKKEADLFRLPVKHIAAKKMRYSIDSALTEPSNRQAQESTD